MKNVFTPIFSLESYENQNKAFSESFAYLPSQMADQPLQSDSLSGQLIHSAYSGKILSFHHVERALTCRYFIRCSGHEIGLNLSSSQNVTSDVALFQQTNHAYNQDMRRLLSALLLIQTTDINTCKFFMLTCYSKHVDHSVGISIKSTLHARTLHLLQK